MNNPGTLGRALAGAATAAQPVVLEAVRAEVLRERDARLQQYSQASQAREFQHQETMQGNAQDFQGEQQQNQQAFQQGFEQQRQQFQAGEAEKGRQFTAQQNAPRLDLEKAQAALADLSVSQQKLVQGLFKEYSAAKDPQDQAKIGNTINMMLGRDVYGAARTYNDMGMPQDVIYSKQTGQTFGPGGTNVGANTTPTINDPFLKGGKSDYSNVVQSILNNGKPVPGKDYSGAPTNGQDDNSAFVAGFNRERGVPSFKSTTPTPAAAPAPAAGSLQPIDTSGPGPFEKVASAVSNAAGAYKQAHYRPGVITGPNGAKTTIQPGMSMTVNGKRLAFQTYIGDSPNGAVWRVIDQQGQMYNYVAPLQ